MWRMISSRYPQEVLCNAAGFPQWLPWVARNTINTWSMTHVNETGFDIEIMVFFRIKLGMRVKSEVGGAYFRLVGHTGTVLDP